MPPPAPQPTHRQPARRPPPPAPRPQASMIARGDVTVLTMTRSQFEPMFGPLQVRGGSGRHGPARLARRARGVATAPAPALGPGPPPKPWARRAFGRGKPSGPHPAFARAARAALNAASPFQPFRTVSIFFKRVQTRREEANGALRCPASPLPAAAAAAAAVPPPQELLNAHAAWKAWSDGQRDLLKRTALLGPDPERVLAVSRARAPGRRPRRPPPPKSGGLSRGPVFETSGRPRPERAFGACPP
jgi:hypothetical protein